MLAVICSAVVAILKFDNKFHYTHERLGLALWILVWIAPLLGFIRPDQYVSNPSSTLSLEFPSFVSLYSCRLRVPKVAADSTGFCGPTRGLALQRR